MPAATTILAGAGLAASTGLGINQAIQGKKQAERAQRAIEGYEREEFRNVYAGITLPVQRTRLETEGVRTGVAGATDALSRAGARGLVGGLPQVQDFASESLARIGSELEQSLFQIQTLIAEDEKRIQSETARREEQDLAGYGALFEAGRQEEALGFSSIPRGFGAASTLLGALPSTPTTAPGGSASMTEQGQNLVNPLEQVDTSRFNQSIKGV